MEIEEYLRSKFGCLKKEAEQIKDHRVFDFNYVPKKPLFREEVQPIAEAVLRDAQTGVQTPNNVFPPWFRARVSTSK